jgi:hypothetical protein
MELTAVLQDSGGECNETLKVIQTWFNSESGMEPGVSQLRYVGLVSIVRSAFY